MFHSAILQQNHFAIRRYESRWFSWAPACPLPSKSKGSNGARLCKNVKIEKVVELSC